MIFDIENWLWKSDLGTFWRPMWTSVKIKSKKYFSFTDFFAKIKPPVDSRSQNFTTEVKLRVSNSWIQNLLDFVNIMDAIKGNFGFRELT